MRTRVRGVEKEKWRVGDGAEEEERYDGGGGGEREIL